MKPETQFCADAIAGISAILKYLNGMRAGPSTTAGLLAATCSLAAGQSFTVIAPAPGSPSSRVTGVSADGLSASGYSHGVGSEQLVIGFEWTAAGGRRDFNAEPGFLQYSPSYGVSGNGGTFVGSTLSSPGTPELAYRWQGPGTFQSLGTLPGMVHSTAYGASGDGSVVVGEARPSGFASRIFRWTEATGMQDLGFTNPEHSSGRAQAISRDGGTVVGYSAGQNTSAFRWTSTTGMVALPLPAGIQSGDATAVSFDGSIIVGATGTSTHHALMWRDGQIIDLGTAPGSFRSYAYGVNDLGTVVVGQVQMNNFQQAASVWTPQTGMVTLASYLALHGVSVPAGVIPYQCTGVSADGNTIVGMALLNGQYDRGFVVTIPTPGGLTVLLGGCFALTRRRR